MFLALLLQATFPAFAMNPSDAVQAACSAFADHTLSEIRRGYEVLGPHLLGRKNITFFGSSRLKENHPSYHLAAQISEQLSKSGWNIISGGGPGMMEAVSKGAKQGVGKSIGISIELPYPETPNDNLDIEIKFADYPIRKHFMITYSQAFIVMPGGYGTLDELFEVVTLKLSKKISDVPIFLVGKDEYWDPILSGLRSMIGSKFPTVSEKDFAFFQFVNEFEEIAPFFR